MARYCELQACEKSSALLHVGGGPPDPKLPAPVVVICAQLTPSANIKARIARSILIAAPTL